MGNDMKNKIIFSILLSLFLGICTSTSSYAEEISNYVNIYISDNFKKELYKPGDSDNLKFVIENNTGNTIKLKKIYLTKKDDKLNEVFNELSNYTNVVIKNNDSIVIKGLLKDVLDKYKFDVAIELKPNSKLEFDMDIFIDNDMGNEAQNCYQELYISTDYEVHSNGIIQDGSQDNTNNQSIKPSILPQTGDPYNYSIIVLIFIGSMLLFIYKKEISRFIK